MRAMTARDSQGPTRTTTSEPREVPLPCRRQRAPMGTDALGDLLIEVGEVLKSSTHFRAGMGPLASSIIEANYEGLRNETVDLVMSFSATDVVQPSGARSRQGERRAFLG